MSIQRFSVFLALPLSLGTAAASTAVTLRPGPASNAITNGDAFVTPGPAGELSGNNYGGAGAWAVATPESEKQGFSSILRFDLADAQAEFDAVYGAGGWTMESVVLRLTTTRANNPIFNATVPGLVTVQWISDDTWTEGVGNPNSPASAGLNWTGFSGLLSFAQPAGTLAVTSTGDGVAADYPLLISPGLRADVAAGGTASFAFTPGDGMVAVLFNSRNFGTASRNPALTMTAAPVPPQITEFKPAAEPGGFMLSFTSPAGMKVIPQSSTDLFRWIDSDPVLTTEGINTVMLTFEPTEAGRFWRLKRTP